MKKKHKKYLCTHCSDDGLDYTIYKTNKDGEVEMHCTKCGRKLTILSNAGDNNEKLFEAIDTVLAGIETLKFLSVGSDEDYSEFYKIMPKIKKLKKAFPYACNSLLERDRRAGEEERKRKEEEQKHKLIQNYNPNNLSSLSSWPIGMDVFGNSFNPFGDSMIPAFDKMWSIEPPIKVDTKKKKKKK